MVKKKGKWLKSSASGLLHFSFLALFNTSCLLKAQEEMLRRSWVVCSPPRWHPQEQMTPVCISGGGSATLPTPISPWGFETSPEEPLCCCDLLQVHILVVFITAPQLGECPPGCFPHPCAPTGRNPVPPLGAESCSLWAEKLQKLRGGSTLLLPQPAPAFRALS